MKTSSFKHPSLEELLSSACGTKYSVADVGKMEAHVLKAIEYNIRTSPLYKPVFRINSHCLVASAYLQNGISLETLLQLFSEKLVLFSFDPAISEECTLLELAYSLLVVVLNFMISQQLTTEPAIAKILATVRLTFRLEEAGNLKIINEIKTILSRNK